MCIFISVSYKLQKVTNECINGDVRLVNGNKDNEGRIEYCYMGKWSPMCSLSTYTAVLICKKLGYAEANNLPNHYYVPCKHQH